MGIILLILLLGILLTLPPVQSFVGRVVTKELKKSTGVDINVDRVAVSIFGGVKLREVLIRDHHQDTMIYAKNIQTRIISKARLIDGDLIFGDLNAKDLVFYMKTYKGEDDSNIGVFVDQLDNGKPSSGIPFIMKVQNLKVANGHFRIENQNSNTPISVDFTQLNADLDHFSIYGDKITADVNMLSIQDHRGIFVQNLKGKAKYSNTELYIKDLDALTKEKTHLIGDIVMTYGKGDMSAFTDKVMITADFKKGSKVASNDIYFFYPEIANGKVFDFNTELRGTLNDFTTTNLILEDKETLLSGNLNFKNLIDTDSGFSISGDITQLTSSGEYIKALLPNILSTLPDELNNLGKTTIIGTMYLDSDILDIKSNITTAIGSAVTDLVLGNLSGTKEISYKGKIATQGFNLGRFLNLSSFGPITADLEVNGEGFTEKTVNSTIEGKINSFYFTGYNYRKILISANLKQPIFKAEVHIDDDNAKLSFKGLLDTSKKAMQYDLEAQVDYADLNVINLVERDAISVLKGNVSFNGEGNSLDEICGELRLTSGSYQNQNDIYFFEDFQIVSDFTEDNIRIISINSPDIMDGELTGRFSYAELPQIFENAFGTLYTNYSPHKIHKNQFLQFDFSIYNKIIEVFYPDISLGKNTFIKGNINPDQEIFKLNFITPSLNIGTNKISRLNLQVDNNNPLYSAYIEMDSLRTKYYKVADFGMINVKHNDTLYFRTEFKGGDKSKDFYNLNMYYTINQEKNSVVGFQKSELNFKDYLWEINPDSDQDNKVVFNKSFSNFSIDEIKIAHENQLIKLIGIVKGNEYKDIDLSFKDVDLSKITPDIENLDLEGLLNGNLHFTQEKNIFNPVASIEIMSFAINEVPLGDFMADIQGDENLRKFGMNAYLYKDSETVLAAEGDLEVINKQTMANFDIRMNRFNIKPFSNFGGDVITNIRGFATGRATVVGNLTSPEINGRIFLDKSGMKVPYLNIDFDLEDNAAVDITDRNIFFRNINLTDTKYKTKSLFDGTITHKLFSDWFLDLNINTNRFLVLDTKDAEDALYYGTAFIKGTATISGPTSGLLIKANATSEKGTSIKIPIGNSKSSGEVSHIKFLSPEEKYNIKKTKQLEYVTSGLEMMFNLNVTPDAEIDIIIDKASGHAIRGGRGTGTLEMNINTLGSFTMNGIFTVEDGHYDFRYGGIISKRFNVKKGGTITWSGSPASANMNIQGVYSTEANPAVLLDNPNFNRKIPVDLVIDIKGTLEALQEPDFTINFPSVSTVLQSEIQYKLSDDDTRRNQAFSLLMFRNFTGSDGMSSGAFAGSLTETASSLFNNLLSNDDSVFQIEVDYTVRNKNPNSSRDFEDFDRLGINVSTQINEDITINGKLGVPVGGAQESVVVGNVEALLRLNEDRSLNARVFNRENDINYFGEGIGYTQGIGITWEANFDTFDELWRKIFYSKKKRREAELREAAESQQDNTHRDADSEFNQDFQKFIQNRGKQRQKQKVDDTIERAPDPF